MAEISKLRMNLSSITKIDPYAKSIIDSSPHVVLYTFETQCGEWEKTDVEGALFIYCRNAGPYYSIFINNRLSTSTFVEPITGQLELISQPPFLLYRDGDTYVQGIWFYDRKECERVTLVLQNLINQSVNNNNLMAKDSKEQNIFAMLGAAQNEQKDKTKRNNIENASDAVIKFFASAKHPLRGSSENFPQFLSPATLSLSECKPLPPVSDKAIVDGVAKEALSDKNELCANVKISKEQKLRVSTDVLNYSQFTQAFTYLLKNNDEFRQTLYNAYIQSNE